MPRVALYFFVSYLVFLNCNKPSFPVLQLITVLTADQKLTIVFPHFHLKMVWLLGIKAKYCAPITLLVSEKFVFIT